MTCDEGHDVSDAAASRLILGIDGGSQSTKVTIFDATGAVCGQGRAPLRPAVLGPGGTVVHPDDDLWDSLCVAIRAALADAGVTGNAIEAIGLCSIRYCRALLDEAGALTEPVLSWMDVRVSAAVSDLDPAVATIASAAGYLTVRLTGQRRDSAAAYKGMWPIAADGLGWSKSDDDFTDTGMPLRLLPQLVPPGGRLGEITATAAEATALAQGCPVFATANDKGVEALGAGLSAATDAGSGEQTVLLSLGTYIASMTPGSASPMHPGANGPHTWVNSASVPGDVLFESKGIRRGMWTVSWLRNLLSAADAATPGKKPNDPEITQAWLEAGASEVPPGAEGLFVVPDFLAGPDGPERRGSILGLAGQHGPHELHRAVLEGIALTMRRHAFSMIEALGIEAPRVVVTGGGAMSDLMMQIVADSWGLPATRAGMPDAAGLGSAICAAVGSGMHPDFPTAIEAMVREGHVFTPEPSAVEVYRGIVAAYDSLLGFTDPMYRHLTAPSQCAVQPCTAATSPE